MEIKQVRILRPDGHDIERLTSVQKNAIYTRARVLKEKIRETLLTRTELWKPTDHNTQKHTVLEGDPEHTKRVEEFQNLMRALWADPKDYSIEKMRKGK